MTMLGTLELPCVYAKNDLSNDAYHGDKAFFSRSQVHRWYEMQRKSGRYASGKAQSLSERGVSAFSGNRGTEVGSLFDEAWDWVVSGKSVGDMLLTAPAEVLTSNGQRRGKAYEQWRDEIHAAGKREANADTVAQINFMIEAVFEHKSAVDLLNRTTHLQRSVFFEHRDGHRLKARYDGEIEGELVYDVKTTSSSWTELAKSFSSFGYFWQAAWYSDSAYQIGYPAFRMPFIVVQSVFPYECQVLRCPDEFVQAARDQIARTLAIAALRRETGEYFPEDYGEVKELDIPAWMWKQEIYGGADE